MKLAISSQGPDLTSPVDPRFGRAAYFVIYDTDSMESTAVSNAGNAVASQGAGVQAAQLVVRNQVDVVVAANIGPKAFEALQSAGIRMLAYNGGGTVGDAVEATRKDELTTHENANVRGHWS
ncbi:dinitrogenase iron-molybdenum cofactor biosynthesis protein [candidate division GN15 bacterium]|nr:dinitrogenase iron-molybdenum cofactor biosynthesis protein [candidate division GN15 bacterium]